MKSSISVLVFLTACVCSFGQTSETKAMLSEIEGKWAVDDNGNVTYQRIVEVPETKKDDIYDRVLNYFIYTYRSGKSVIQSQDKEQGQIIGKGFFENIHTFSNGIGFVYLGTWHIIRVDVKEGRARIIITLTEFMEDFQGSSSSKAISGEYPINKDGSKKNIYGKAFYLSHKKANSAMDAVEKAIKEGSTTKQLEDDKW